MPPSGNDLLILRRRAEFLAVAAHGKKWVTTAFIIQWASSTTLSVTRPVVRFGLTASGKVGNAVTRNRARRRLRALAKDILPSFAKAGHDYVLIARAAALTHDYQDLKKDLVWALKKLGALAVTVP